MSTFDERSEKNLKTLLPLAEQKMRALLAAVQAAMPAGVTVKVISGTRTYKEQDALYAQGRTAPGPVVTNAKGGYSNHNFGVAVDLGIFKGAEYLSESPLYARAGKVGESLGLLWGGRWTFRDEPHFEVPTGLSLAEMRHRKAAGVPILPEPVPTAWRVVVGGKQVAEASLVGGSAVAPVRAVAEALGATVAADGTARTITLTPKT